MDFVENPNPTSQQKALAMFASLLTYGGITVRVLLLTLSPISNRYSRYHTARIFSLAKDLLLCLGAQSFLRFLRKH